MIRLLFVVIIFCQTIGIITTSAQEIPDWTIASKRKKLYPDSVFFMVFKSEIVENADEVDFILESLAKRTKKEISEQIQISIKTVSLLKIDNDDKEFETIYNQSILRVSDASLRNLRTQISYDPKRKLAYAISYIKKQEMVKSCNAAILELYSQVELKIKYAENCASSSKIKFALFAYYDCYPLIKTIKKEQSLLLAVDPNVNFNNMLDLQNKVDIGINDLVEKIQSNLDDACFILAIKIKQQLTKLIEDGLFDNAGHIIIGSFRYRENVINNQFSRLIRNNLSLKLTSLNFNVYFESPSTIAGPTEWQQNNNEYVLLGSYSDESDRIVIFIDVSDNLVSKKLVSVRVTLDKKWVKERNISFDSE